MKSKSHLHVASEQWFFILKQKDPPEVLFKNTVAEDRYDFLIHFPALFCRMQMYFEKRNW